MYGNVKKMVLASLFIAIEIITTRFLSIQTPINRISLDFIPLALSAIILGPYTAGVTAAIADIFGMLIFPKGGAYFPGFTLSAFVSGFLYGFILYQKKITIKRCFFAVLTVIISTSLVLNTIWLVIITNKAAFAILSARIVKDLIMLPIQTFFIYYVWRAIESTVKNTLIFNKTF
ncbi:folate family ECF transporter S component [Ruminiclostridium papyrosolvens]|uniref:Folate transporter FolT n=1 Tax=Ruminiclostridium papyrosolvens C7 TaxID=1330534 RepID=U4QYR9_9FIRM|nr:folate family ECF transporter S component [Ruminiclostridium papyrosolvens]EPR09228.1 folate transporter FolT [Ruminiclostridium papyrosolvens C7]